MSLNYKIEMGNRSHGGVDEIEGSGTHEDEESIH